MMQRTPVRKALDPAPADALAVVFPPDPSFVHPFAVARASGTLDLRADHSEASGKQSLHLDTNSLEAHISCSFCSLQAQPFCISHPKSCRLRECNSSNYVNPISCMLLTSSPEVYHKSPWAYG